MTALIVYESFNLSEYIEINLPEKYIYEGKVAYLKTGQTMTVENLLEYLLIYSANDASFASSLLVSDSVNEFIDLMNTKAQELGMSNTRFANPDGLDEDGHYTTLYDILIRSQEIIQNYELINILMRNSFVSDLNGENREYLNTNKLINKNFHGLKTGWTDKAGLTFVGYNQSNNRNILTIVNQSIVNDDKDNHFKDTIKLYNLSIDTFKNQVLIDNNSEIYVIRSNASTQKIFSDKSWIVFENRYKNEKIKLNILDRNTLNFINDNNTYNLKISKSKNSIKWKFELFRFFSINANDF